MKRSTIGLILAGILLLALSNSTLGQVGVGLKVPSTEVFVATTLSDGLMIEAGVPILALTNGVFTVVVDGKLMISSFNVADRPLIPFVGAGVAVTPFATALIISPHGMAGMEFRLGEPHLALFLELGAGVAFTSVGMVVGFNGQAGARLSF